MKQKTAENMLKTWGFVCVWADGEPCGDDPTTSGVSQWRHRTGDMMDITLAQGVAIVRVCRRPGACVDDPDGWPVMHRVRLAWVRRTDWYNMIWDAWGLAQSPRVGGLGLRGWNAPGAEPAEDRE